jgi:hypothetical protein
MQPALGRRRHRRSDITISLVSRGYAVGCYVRSPSQRWKYVAASSASYPVMRVHSLSWAAWLSRDTHRGPLCLSPVFTGLIPSGLTPSSVLKCGLIDHCDRVATYVPRAGAREYDYAREGLKLAC